VNTGRDGFSRRDVVGTAAALAFGLGGAEAAVPGAGPSRIMLIRHAEKPKRGGEPPYGLGPDGRHDENALLVEGWQRAGALAGFFAPRDGSSPPVGIARPTFLAAAAPTTDHPSRRSVLTLAPLAALTGLVPDTRFGPNQVEAAAAAVLRQGGVGLLAWEHKRIPDLVTALTHGSVAPPHWSGGRFDMVLVLDRDGPRWRLTQVPQLLLAGDSANPLRDRRGDD